VKAWHFVGPDGRLGNDLAHLPPVHVGQVVRADGPLKLCTRGLHASERPLDALLYAPGPAICRVDCNGEIIHCDDKLVCSEREVLWMHDITRELRLLACWCVRHTPLGDGRFVWELLTDECSRRAVEVAERYALGQATDEEMATASAVARAVSEATAYGAARAAARAAAWAVSEATACGAARTAVRTTDWAVSEAAAGVAARAAARAAQNAELERVLHALMREEGVEP
jgi:hypothetical protein